MKFIVIISVLIIGFGGLFFVLKSNTPGTQQSQSFNINTIQNDVASGGQFIDVRTPEEFASGHIAGATNIPLQNFQTGYALNSQKEKPIYLYCRSGNRSSQAATLLRNAGFTNVVDLGAITKVQKLGGTLET